MNPQEIEKKAIDVLNQWHLLQKPVDPVSLAGLLEIPVFSAQFKDPNVSGYIRSENGEVKIFVNRNESTNRRRFTVAHELGHHLLKHFEGQSTYEKEDTLVQLLKRTVPSNSPQSGWDRKEVEANQFAAALLMPEELVRREFETEKSIRRLAETFVVSEEAMRIRLQVLGLLAKATL